MSYTNDDIKARAELLCGGSLDDNSGRVLSALCAAAAKELEGRLRQGVNSESLGELFVTAAGMLALALCMELNGSGVEGVTSFRAGSLSASLGAGVSAASLRKAAESLLSAYLEDGGFSFVGVL